MGVRPIVGEDRAAMYCSTTDWAFGPVFYDKGNHGAHERMLSFLRYIKPVDPRKFTDEDLRNLYHQWLAQEDAQWRKEVEEGTEEMI
jgi:hypothetical protein